MEPRKHSDIVSDEKVLKTILNAEEYIHPLSPAQQAITFEDWAFDSSFDSGNLQKIEQIGPNEFDFWCAPDNYATDQESAKRFWFYFQVIPLKPIPKGEERVVTFTCKNQSKMQNHLFSHGMVPVYKSTKSDGWHYLPRKLSKYTVGKVNIQISFQYKFTHEDERVYLAYSFPYSYTNVIKLVDELDRTYNNDEEIYFHRELLTLTQQHRRIDLLTITKKDEKQSEYPVEKDLEHLFPLHHSEIKDPAVRESMNPKLFKRPPLFPKKYIFVTARVHASEAPGSFMFESFIRKLLDKKDEISRKLLEKYVFVMIPILNPDGVAIGNSRYDLFARDTNRIFDKPKFATEPPQYAVIQLAKEFGKTKRLWMFLDMHAHCNHDGVFVFGTLGKEKQQKLEAKTFIRILDCYSKHFDFETSSWNNCDFEKPNGVAKNAVMFHSHCTHAYTLEASYFIGTKDSERYQKYTVEDLKRRCEIKEGQKKEGEGEYKAPTQTEMAHLFPKTQYALKPEHFTEVGDVIRHAILETTGDHPGSKLGDTCFGGLKKLTEFQHEQAGGAPVKKKSTGKKGSKKAKKKGSDDEEEEDEEDSHDDDHDEEKGEAEEAKKDREEL